MKSKSWLSLFALLVMGLFMGAGYTRYEIQEAPEFPVEVDKVLRNSCFACHTTEARNEEAKSALGFNMWDKYGLPGKISLLDEICEECKAGEMPLKSYLLIHRDARIGPDEIESICDWAESEAMNIIISEQGEDTGI